MENNELRSRPEDIFSKRASFYATSKIHDDKETLTWFVELANPGKDMIALDVGTGTGHSAMALAPYVRHVDALDLTEQMMDEGRKLCIQKGITNVRFMLGDAMNIPFPDGHFDIVVSRRAAHHFRDIHRSIEEMARVLRPGGRVVVDDRTVPEDDEVDSVINRLDVLHDPSHVRDYRASEWTSLLEKAGLHIESVRLYRRHIPLTHFTEMVDHPTAHEMKVVAMGMSDGAKAMLHFEGSGEKIALDNIFVLIAAVK